jgi:uncharacterized protein (DUF362 family)/NAD-dependent dihydropyrimidine dehydrogenase PreA subunit
VIGCGMNNLVSVVPCNDYSTITVRNAIKRSVGLLGGIEKFVEPADRVFLKVNMLRAAKPEQAVTTHPAIVDAVIHLLKGNCAEILIGDSPGSCRIEDPSEFNKIAAITGIKDIAENNNCELIYLDSYKKDGKFVISNILNRVDKIINLPKFKTHILTYISGAIKNIYGLIPGDNKKQYHAKLRKENKFAEFLTDLYDYVKPTLNIMDLVVGMDGEGPSYGKPRHVGLVLASENGYAIDLAATSAVGLDAKKVPTLMNYSKGFEIVSGKLSVIDEVFEEPILGPSRIRTPLSAANEALDSNLPMPKIDYNLCGNCYTCVEKCPGNAIRIYENKPTIDLEHCIKCYCCQELCPNNAIKLEVPGGK